jgi:geranylgeranyl diphosphate synthase type II
LIDSYRQAVLTAIQENLGRLGPKTALRDACEYALMNGGKRLRPAIVLMIAKELGHGIDATPAALAIEYFHTASLVADDLPCMDDDDERRSKPSVHKVYGEAMALLVSYALIAAGYACYAQNANLIKKRRDAFSAKGDLLCTLVLENATYNTGLWGATGGQFLDLNPSDLSLTSLRNILHKKTVSLFEISFVSGWLFGGGSIEALGTVKRAASHFGMAFQIADDIDDLEKDRHNGRVVNMAAVFGVDTAQNMLREEIEAYETTLRELNLSSLVPLTI